MNDNTKFAQTTKLHDTPFMTFWLVLNYHLNKRGLPEVRFRDARELWEAAIEAAEMRVSHPTYPK